MRSDEIREEKMNRQIKVSIIIAIYKSEKYIRKCIDSVLQQTYENIEIILVDDGSPDDCPRICDEYAKSDPRIVVLHKKNGGACEARNEGLKKVTGDYISIIDGDDWLEVDYVEYLLNIITITNADMAMTDHIFTTRDREQVESDTIEEWTNEEAAIAIIYPRIAIGPWNKLYSTSLIKDNHIDFSVPWSGEGLYFSCMAAQHSKKVAVGHRKVYNYRLNNIESGLTRYRVEMGINALQNIKNIEEVSIVRTRKFMNAINWHIWKNYNYVLFLIIATDSKQENQALLCDCKRNIRKMLPSVLMKSEIGKKAKIKTIIKGIIPEHIAKKEFAQAQRDLANDKFE